ncbi:MAG: tyrosine-type recombinase/integrase [candidate division Zixibacteria bacterium]|nr:tyrosine-type recombinase/integrase [candidate division Zixibacteria bacterium]MBU1471092.1 tyrosine-type recombinase/integrase [candidate division Zixibacteria bacterium]MBU2624730.1 tyrosine-type recombinase/integrase [candidate division Zixibacteria bacterium]
MGSIYRRGKTWYVDLYVRGRRIRRKVGRSKKIAVLALKDAEVKAARDEFGFAKNDIAIEKLLAQFLEYSQANNSPATFTRYRAVLDHFNEFLKDHQDVVFLSQVNPRLLDEYKVGRKNEWVNPNGGKVESDDDITDHTRKGARAHTINFEIDVFRTIFNLAIKWGYLKENPTKAVDRLKVKDSKTPRFLTEKECQLLIEHSPDHLYPIFFTFLNTGMRKAELENLEWADIDLKRRKIKIRKKDFWHPKTGEREIPVGQKLLDLLTNLNQQNDQGIKSSFVFPDKSGGKIRMKLREQLIRIARTAGIENLTQLHALRHIFASHLMMKGVALPSVQKLMGHSDIQTTMIYAYLAPDHLSDAVDKLEF